MEKFTDEELANSLRLSRAHSFDLAQELIKRGYGIRQKDSEVPLNFRDAYRLITITKTVKKEI